MIRENTWDDEWFLDLAMRTKLVWCWAGTTEYALPGLVRGSILSFADQLRLSLEDTEASFEELIRAGRFEFDPQHRLLRVVDEIAGCRNQNILRGWYLRWQRLPESILKYNHISTVRQSVTKRKWFRTAWKDTFGEVEVPRSKREPGSPQLRLIGSDQQQSTQTETVGVTVREQLNPKLNDSACLNSSRTVRELYQDHSQDQDQDQDQRGAIGPTTGMSLSERLWARQEQYRAELRLSPLQASEEDLARVDVALEESGFTEGQAQAALRSYREQCRRDITKARWFNGRTNWDPRNMQVAASMAPAPGNGTAGRLPDLTEEALRAASEPPVPREAREAFAAEWGAKSGQEPSEDAS